jgi:hypothetical protein
MKTILTRRNLFKLIRGGFHVFSVKTDTLKIYEFTRNGDWVLIGEYQNKLLLQQKREELEKDQKFIVEFIR